jgi:hypothetical protein
VTIAAWAGVIESTLSPSTGAGPNPEAVGRAVGDPAGVGVVAAAGLAYAAWQTLRADDELWVSDEADDDETDAVSS